MVVVREDQDNDEMMFDPTPVLAEEGEDESDDDFQPYSEDDSDEEGGFGVPLQGLEPNTT